jgi:hypothetical protein
LDLIKVLRVARSFTEKPNGSNSTIHQLSRVKRWTEIRFLIIDGETRILEREELGPTRAVPVPAMGILAPLPTVMN